MSIDLLRSPEVFLNLNVRGMGESATLAINERSCRLAAQGRSVYRLGLGQSPFPVPDHVRESLMRNAHQKDYLPGFFVFPRGLSWLADAMAAVASETFTSTSAPIQYAAVTALEEHPAMDLYLLHCRRILAALSEHAFQTLSDAGAMLSQPSGGFYLFPRFEPHRGTLSSRGIEDGQGFCERLLEETGVAVLPGHSFGRAARELSARVAIVDFDGGIALQKAAKETVDKGFVRRYCNRVTRAVESMAAWAMG